MRARAPLRRTAPRTSRILGLSTPNGGERTAPLRRGSVRLAWCPEARSNGCKTRLQVIQEQDCRMVGGISNLAPLSSDTHVFLSDVCVGHWKRGCGACRRTCRRIWWIILGSPLFTNGVRPVGDTKVTKTPIECHSTELRNRVNFSDLPQKLDHVF